MPSEPTPTTERTMDDAILGAIDGGAVTFDAIRRSVGGHYRQIDGALQSLRRRGVLTYSRKPGWQRTHPVVGGAAPSAPTVDAHMIHGLERCIAAAHRLLDEHHDATVADRQDAEDAERLLAVLRGGATAPTPDPTTAEDTR
jgi:hypothetical protein